jgi:hypothetical protein
MLQLLLALTAGLGGYLVSRNFVRTRLRFVDAIHGVWFPLVAGVLGFLLVWPLAILPMVSAAPAALFGLGVGLGTVTGARMSRRTEDPRRRLVP